MKVNSLTVSSKRSACDVNNAKKNMMDGKKHLSAPK